MGYGEEKIFIKATAEKLYETVKDVPAVLDRVPGYKVKILNMKSKQIIFQVSARYLLNFTWQTAVDISNPLYIHFKQIKGPLKGLTAAWIFVPAVGGCHFIITHDVPNHFYGFLRLPIPEKTTNRLLYKYCIENVARGILADIKKRAET